MSANVVQYCIVCTANAFSSLVRRRRPSKGLKTRKSSEAWNTPYGFLLIGSTTLVVTSSLCVKKYR